MDALGVPETYAMERMGHSTNSMLKHYQESIKEKNIEINNALMDYMNSLNNPTETTTEITETTQKTTN